jgi:hypothetical protein
MKEFLRATAIVGYLAAIASGVYRLFPMADREWLAVVPVVFVTVLTTLAFAVLLRKEAAILFRHPDLLVPLGVRTLAITFLWNLVVEFPPAGFLGEVLFAFRVLNFGVSVTIWFLLLIAIFIAYAAWVTPMLWQAIREDRVDVTARGRETPRRFIPALVVESIGTLGIVVLMLPALNLPGELNIAAFGMLLAASIVWNLLTAALVPVGLQGRPGAIPDVGRAFRLGLRRWPRWAPAVLAQLFILGAATIVWVEYTDRRREVNGNRTTTTVHHVDRVNWGTKAFWTGGYEDDSEWTEEFMEALEAPEPALAGAVLTMLLGALALAVKLKVMGIVLAPARAPPGES